MGDTKHIRLTVRSASQKEIQDAIHRDFRPGVRTHKCSKGADGNSVTVEVVGDVDAGKLYDRLKKIASRVEIEIESVIPEKMMELEKDLKSENKTTRKTNQRLLSENKSLDEDNKRLLSENKSLDEDNKYLRRKIEALKNNNKGGTSSAAVQGLNNLIIERDREHEIKQLKETIVHLNSKISTLEKINTILEDGRRATKTELGRLNQQLG